MPSGRSKATMASSTGPASDSKVSGVPQAGQKPRRTRFELWK
jgi:hypothetical protein